MAHVPAAVAVVVAGAFVAACSAGGSGVEGVPCTSDRDCQAGLRCLSESLQDTDGGCSSIGQVCLVVCGQDSDCTSALGVGFACGASRCGASQLACQPEAEPSGADGAGPITPDGAAGDGGGE